MQRRLITSFWNSVGSCASMRGRARPSPWLGALALLLGLPSVACEPIDADGPRDEKDGEVEVQEQPILAGANASVPWVGQVFDWTDDGYAGLCTGSLVNERVVLTASHCVRAWTGMADRYAFQLEGTNDRIPGFAIVNFGPDAGRHLGASELEGFFSRNLTTTPDGRGNNDVALLVLDRPVYLTRYAQLSTSFPDRGQTATAVGYGCVENRTGSGSGFLRFKSWAYSGERSSEASAALCNGDSGGPAWTGGIGDASRSIWGVNSSGNGSFDTYGNVVAFWSKLRFTAEVLRDQLAESSFPVLAKKIQGGRTLTQGEFWRGSEGEFVLTGQETLVVSVTNVAGDPDLYVKRDGVVDTASYDCRPYFGANQSESCVFFQPGRYSIGVRGYSSASFDLRAYVVKTGVNVIAAGQWAQIPDGIHVNGGQSLRVLTGGHGDVDLYVRRGKPPTEGEFDCRSRNADAREVCEISAPGTYFVGILGKGAFSTASLFVEQRR